VIKRRSVKEKKQKYWPLQYITQILKGVVGYIKEREKRRITALSP
jgi:hypothetical protein